MKKFLMLGMSAVLVLSLCACSFSFSSANFQNLAMSAAINEQTFKPVNPATSFPATTPTIYLTGTLNNAPGKTVIKVKWFYIEETPAEDLGEQTFDVKNSNTDFEFHLSKKTAVLPAGKYEVRLYLDDKIEKAVKFEVTEADEPSTAATTAPATAAPTTEYGITEPDIAYFQNLETSEGVNEDTFEPVSVTDTFTTASPIIYLTGSLENANIGDKITIYWQYTEGYTPVDLYNSSLDIEHVNTDFYFYLKSPDEGWQRGSYEIQLYINGVYDTTVYFYVE